MRKIEKKSDKAGFFLLLAVGASLALALVFGPSLYSDKKLPSNKLSVSNSPMITETIGQLSTAESSSLRMNAARWLSTQFPNNPDTVIRSLGDSLNNDPDPIVRAQAANSLASIARQARETTSADAEKQIADVLARRYAREASDTVRRCIIGAAAELDNEAAGPLVDKAIADNDPAVKEEALRARVERERRAQLKKLG